MFLLYITFDKFKEENPERPTLLAAHDQMQIPEGHTDSFKNISFNIYILTAMAFMQTLSIWEFIGWRDYVRPPAPLPFGIYPSMYRSSLSVVLFKGWKN